MIFSGLKVVPILLSVDSWEPGVAASTPVPPWGRRRLCMPLGLFCSVSRTHLNLDERERERQRQRERVSLWELTACLLSAARLCSVTMYQSCKMTKLWVSSPNCLAQDLETLSLGEAVVLPFCLHSLVVDVDGIDLSQRTLLGSQREKSAVKSTVGKSECLRALALLKALQLSADSSGALNPSVVFFGGGLL